MSQHKRAEWSLNSPVGLAAALGLGAYGLTNWGWDAVSDTAYSLMRPFAGRMTPDEDAEARWRLKADPRWRRGFAGLAGLLAAAGTLGVNWRNNEEWGGIGSWRGTPDGSAPTLSRLKVPRIVPRTPAAGSPGQVKTGSLDPFADGGWMRELDWDRRLPRGAAEQLFRDDPALNGTLAGLRGEAIVNDAAIRAHTSTPTLGQVHDSAVDKVSHALSLGGLAKAGVRSVLANQTARLFAGALDCMAGIGPEARRTLIDAGTWAGAIGAILE